MVITVWFANVKGASAQAKEASKGVFVDQLLLRGVYGLVGIYFLTAKALLLLAYVYIGNCCFHWLWR